MGNSLPSPTRRKARYCLAGPSQMSSLPRPIERLLRELYRRGPSTVGIFRKSPNAKHCSELKKMLETDNISSLEDFQVTVIASVFKEWLRSLPDCLLMSRLYPQWIDVAKLIEPLYNDQNRNRDSVLINDDSSFEDMNQNHNHNHNITLGDHFDSPNRVIWTETGNNTNNNNGKNIQSTPQRINNNNQDGSILINRTFSYSSALDHLGLSSPSSSSASASSSPSFIISDNPRPNEFKKISPPATPQSVSSFALLECHSECLRIVKQLLNSLEDRNLILLRSLVCVLWHIANNSDYNKMSPINLGVCVGQSILNNDKNQKRFKTCAPLFVKRRRGSNSSNNSNSNSNNNNYYYNNNCNYNYNYNNIIIKSNPNLNRSRWRQNNHQSPLFIKSVSSLSLNGQSPTSQQSLLSSSLGSLDPYCAQESARYVPILIAFLIENATSLFGPDITKIFAEPRRSSVSPASSAPSSVSLSD